MAMAVRATCATASGVTGGGTLEAASNGSGAGSTDSTAVLSCANQSPPSATDTHGRSRRDPGYPGDEEDLYGTGYERALSPAARNGVSG